MGPIDLVVFDLAGTTIDDRGGLVLRCLMESVQIHDLPGTSEELNALMGRDKREVFRLLADRIFPHEAESAERIAGMALETFTACIRSAYGRELAPLPGVEEVFAFLRSRHVRVATDTGFDDTINGIIMQTLDWPGRLIDLALCSSDVSRGRPAPYMIFAAMEKLGVLDVRRVMKVGDSPADMEEGWNAGCGETVGVLSGAHTVASLGSCRHTRLLESVADLPDLFDRAP